jgi:enamine deaminase RidA (YjgF/YER057c/UK114 family)
MKKSKMVTPRLPEAKAAFSRGTKVELDSIHMLFISGTASVNARGKTVHPGDLPAQVRHTYKNIVSLLEKENAGLKDVAKFTVFLKNMDDYDKFNKAREEFFEASGLIREEFPASTCVQARLCREDLLVEIEAIAMVPKVK